MNKHYHYIVVSRKRHREFSEKEAVVVKKDKDCTLKAYIYKLNLQRWANQNPYSEGWVLRIHSNNLRHDLKNLMISSETEDFLKEEVGRLYQVIEDTVPMVADGGNLKDDIYGKMPEIGWKRLTKLFLHT